MKPVIAIDGPAGSGKGTIACRLADRLGFAYLDTGLLYRIVAYKGVETCSKMTINDFLKIISDTPRESLRTTEIGDKASHIAKLPRVRECITKLQRDFIANPGDKYKGSVLDGRDIGTVVAPNADCKLFITADLEIRARRRFTDLKRGNDKITFDEICKNLKHRDERDESRKNAPLIFTDDYILINTTDDTPNESLAKVIKACEKLCSLAG